MNPETIIDTHGGSDWQLAHHGELPQGSRSNLHMNMPRRPRVRTVSPHAPTPTRHWLDLTQAPPRRASSVPSLAAPPPRPAWTAARLAVPSSTAHQPSPRELRSRLERSARRGEEGRRGGGEDGAWSAGGGSAPPRTRLSRTMRSTCSQAQSSLRGRPSGREVSGSRHRALSLSAASPHLRISTALDHISAASRRHLGGISRLCAPPP